MSDSAVRRFLSPVVTFREGETLTGVLMFAYSFLAMTAYNNIRPAATSKFISDLGADNLPWVYLVAGLTLGVILQYYGRLVDKIPRRWVLPGTQLLVVAVLVGFWFLLKTEQAWVSAALYFWGRMLLGIFLISQFWTLANDIYDPRQAKRVFGFIGGGASLGGLTGAALTAFFAERVGTDNLLLFSAAILFFCFFIVVQIERREVPAERAGSSSTVAPETVSGKEAIQMLRDSKHLRLIALLIGFGALGGLTLDQQLNSAAEELVQTEDAVTGFLGSITAYLSAIGFLVQVGLVSYVHRALGIGFALLVLPVSWGASALLILFAPVLWTISLARILDASLRYTLDKTTREVLFLPLPADLKFKAKPFVDVTADRFVGKGLGAAVLLVLIKLFGFTWWQLSYLSLTVCVVWLYLTRKARQEYMAVFRRSIERLELEPGTLAPQVGEPATIETLVEELASPDENRVIRSIELLESLDKPHLVTPLLLRHESPRVRSRALLAMKQASPGTLARSALAVERSLEDEDADVRAEAVSVLAVIRGKDVTAIMRPYLEDKDSRIATAAAASLAESDRQDDRLVAEETLARLAADTREAGKTGRRDVARALARCSYGRFRRLLIPLMHDADTSVALESIRSSRHLGDQDLLFVPALVSRLADRRLKNAARGALASYGERVVDTLGYFLVDANENIWVRRHIPGTLARIPSRPSVEVLLGALDDDDGFIRFKAVSALERIQKARPDLGIETAAVEKITVRDIGTYYRCLGAGFNLFDRGGLPRDNLLGQALDEKRRRAIDRVYRLLALALDRKDVRAARWAIERGDGRSRASAVEYLDNVLSGRIRKMLLPILDEAPLEETVRKGNVFLKTRIKGIEETLARLIYDDDPVIAATAIDLVREREVWSLAEDLEQVLQFREPKDYIVFESASQALAEYRSAQSPPA